MPEIFATPGLGWLVCAVIAAGMVRGFTGFGSAMIIMPAASSVLSPFGALVFLMVVELFGPLPNLPDALRKGNPAETGRLLLGAALALPVGLWLLGMVSPDVFSWIVSGCVFALLCLLISGWRLDGYPGPASVVGIGALGGFMTGIAGLAGPPVIMFYMSGRQAISAIRANLLLYLLGIDVLVLILIGLMGAFDWTAMVIGGILVVPYMLANMAGARLFNPEAERTFRAVAYVIIAASALLGLPIWE